MDEYTEKWIKSRPQRLCKMCGKCCRVATTLEPYEKLLEFAKRGEKDADKFLDVFIPYNSIEDARLADASTVDNIINMLKSDNKFVENELTFYHCKYIKDDNLCGRYEDRPELCDRFPSGPWAVVPPECGFEGWLFQEREKRKAHIRKLKEEALSFELELAKLKSGNDPQTAKKLQDGIRKINEIVELYSQYGAKDW